MEDIEMNNDESSNKPQSNKIEDSSIVLDNIENELRIINNTFLDSLNKIKTFAPFLEKGSETNMEKTEFNGFRNEINNYDEERNNFDNTVNDYSNLMNEHFNKILDLTNKLKQFDEFNTKEDDLKKKLEQLKSKNLNSTKKMKEKLQSVEKIFGDLNSNNSMQQEINRRREQFDESLDDI